MDNASSVGVGTSLEDGRAVCWNTSMGLASAPKRDRATKISPALAESHKPKIECAEIDEFLHSPAAFRRRGTELDLAIVQHSA